MPLFHEPHLWPRHDLVAATLHLDPATVYEAYRRGLFPMPVQQGVFGWFSPMRRGILPLDGLKVSRSLRKMVKRYHVSIDRAFEEVVRRCGDPARPDGWIDEDIVTVYTDLYRLGIAHSVETWTDDGRLAGGLYGVSIGGLFAGESMFHDPVIGRDASKVALVELVSLLDDGEPGRLLDVQWQTPHLASLGVIEIFRKEYLALLRRALRVAPPAWSV